MPNSSERPADDVETLIEKYGNMLLRLCLVMLGNEHDAEDVIQETVIKYWEKKIQFEDAEHEKAWLITVATNKCRDILRFKFRHPQTNLDFFHEVTYEPPESGIVEALMTLPDKFRIVLYLHYVEDYRVEDIAQIIGKTSSAVKMRLQKGRKLLEKVYRKEFL